jgi:hypothetical protein
MSTPAISRSDALKKAHDDAKNAVTRAQTVQYIAEKEMLEHFFPRYDELVVNGPVHWRNEHSIRKDLIFVIHYDACDAIDITSVNLARDAHDIVIIAKKAIFTYLREVVKDFGYLEVFQWFHDDAAVQMKMMRVAEKCCAESINVMSENLEDQLDAIISL